MADDAPTSPPGRGEADDDLLTPPGRGDDIEDEFDLEIPEEPE